MLSESVRHLLSKAIDMYKKISLLILGTFFTSIFVLNECRKIDGYKFPVYSTALCPRNETEWNERSSALNCTESNGYTCLPNQNFTELLEFCYTEPLIWIQKGFCLFLVSRVSKVQSYDCSHFIDGCHNSSYGSNKIFKYPACITIGNGCFLAEPFCESTTTKIYPQEATENMQTRTKTFNEKNDWVWILSLAVVVSIICVSFCMLYFCRRRSRGCFFKKRYIDIERKKSGDQESLQLLQPNKHENNSEELITADSTPHNTDRSMNINDNNCAKVSHDISNWDFGENTSASDKANDSIVPTIQGSIQQPLSSNVIPKPATSTSLSKNLQDTTDSTTNKFSKFVDAVLRNTSDFSSYDVKAVLRQGPVILKLNLKNSEIASQNVADQVCERSSFLGENQHTDKGLKYEEQQLHNNTALHNTDAVCVSNKARHLYEACQNGQDNIVEQVLRDWADNNLCQNDVALAVACQNGHNSTVQLLLRNGANINLCKKNGTSPLFLACQNGHESTVKILIKNGAEINLCQEHGACPLYVACQNGHYSTVQILLRNKADINMCTKSKASPLYVACQNGRESTATLLLTNGADINLCIENGASPLFIACQNGHDTLVQLLLSSGADINLCLENKDSALYIACQNGHKRVVELLLNWGTNINVRSDDGASPLLIACQNGHYDTVHLLLNNGADINLGTLDGTSPLIISCFIGNYAIVQLLLIEYYNADVNLCTYDGASPLFISCQNGHDDSVQLLLSNGADVNLCMEDGASPLYAACEFGHRSTVKILLLNKADINVCMNDGDQPLHAACYNGHTSIVEVLLDKGSNINLNNKRELSPLYIAFHGRHYETVQFLLKKGADPYIANGCGFKSSSIDWFDENDRTVQFLRCKDNIIENIHDPDSFFSLFVFCQVENADRIIYEFFDL